MTIIFYNLLKDNSISNYWRGRFEILGKDIPFPKGKLKITVEEIFQ